MSEEDKTRFEVAKEWTKKNWKPFVAGAAVAGITVFVLRGRSAPTQIITNVTPVFNNDNSSSVVNFGGRMTKIVKRVSDGKVWEKVTEAAEEAGTSASFMSRHLHGHKPDVFGEEYRIIGIATTG